MARILPPVPGPGSSQNDYAWLDWYEKVSRAIENTSSVDWNIIVNTPTTLAGYGITDAQPLDATLTALAGLNTTTGLVEQTGTDVFAKRAIGAASATDIPTYADAQALITAHEAELDPHPQYTTDADVASDIADHVAATDPHGDRAYAAAQDALHVAAADPHPQYETSAEVTSKIATHSAAIDPHGDRAFATAADSTLIANHLAAADPHTQYVQVAGDTLTGVVLNTDGTVSLPSMSFSSDPDTGFYSPATNSIGFTTNGVERVRVTTNGMVIGGTTNSITGVGALAFGVKGTTYNTSGGFLTRYDNGSDSSYFVLGKSRGATIDALDAVVSADFLGKFICSGTYGTGMGTGGTIYMQAAENWTATNRGTSFGISLNANGATTGTGRFFINSFGAIGVTSANYGTAGQYLRSSGNAAPPTWSDPLGGASPWVYLKRTSNFTTTSTTYVNVTTLTFTPSANLTYEIEGFFIIDGSVAAAEPSVYISWPTGMTAGAYQLQTINGTSATGPYTIIGGSTDNITPVDSTSDHSAKLHATIVTGAAPSGAVQVQLKSSSANTVTMKTGSWIRYRQI